MVIMADINPNMIVDNMEPWEFRFKKNVECSELYLPLTPNNEQYLLLKQSPDGWDTHYYVLNGSFLVIGRFDCCVKLKQQNCGISYHIIDEYQNRGIGQTVLSAVVQDLFDNYGVERLIVRPTSNNVRSVSIASKAGFVHMKGMIWELKSEDYYNSKSGITIK